MVLNSRQKSADDKKKEEGNCFPLLFFAQLPRIGPVSVSLSALTARDACNTPA
jgi:hypothetical protein